VLTALELNVTNVIEDLLLMPQQENVKPQKLFVKLKDATNV
jgi:hypothetical protein